MKRLLTVPMAAALFGAAAPASAEWFIDAYGRYSWTANVEVSGTAEVSALGYSSAVPFRVATVQRANRRFFPRRIARRLLVSVSPQYRCRSGCFYFEPDVEEQTGRPRHNHRSDPRDLRPADHHRRRHASAAHKEKVPAAVISPDLRVRWRLKPTTNVPQGSLQPYLMAGPRG
jgi:hypothetical protein